MIPYDRIYFRTLLRIAVLVLTSAASAQIATNSRAAAIFDSMPHAKRISQAVISPDGAHVAYIADGKLTVASVENGSTQNIAIEGDLPLRSVCWSADSKQLAFIADLTGTALSAQVWTAMLGGGSPTARAELKGYVDAPSFSPDSSKLALLFIEGMPRSAGPLQPMTPLAGVVGEKIYEQRLKRSISQRTPLPRSLPPTFTFTNMTGFPTVKAG